MRLQPGRVAEMVREAVKDESTIAAALREAAEIPDERPPWTPFERANAYRLPDGTYVNSRYQVGIKRREDTPWGLVTCLSIKDQENTARHDWREMQRIKNQLVNPESEAVEIYPAESRLVDTANQFFLWCLEPGRFLPIGFGERLVSEETHGFGRQRRWEDDARPADLTDIPREKVLEIARKSVATT